MYKIKVGQRVKIGGGYATDMWLAGTTGEGVVVSFQTLPSKDVPVMFIELDDRIVAYEGKYEGKIAAVKPRYVDDDWNTDELVVQAYLMDTIPTNVSWFENRERIEVETHASLDIV